MVAEVTLTALAAAFKDIYEGDGGYYIRLYSAPRRASEVDSIGAAVLLCSISVAAAPISFELPVGPTLYKATVEVWEGANIASGTAVWGCVSPISDTGAASTTIHRTDFSVGLWTDDPLPQYKMSDNVLIATEISKIN